MKKYVAIVAAALVSSMVMAAHKPHRMPAKVDAASAPVSASAPVDAASATSLQK